MLRHVFIFSIGLFGCGFLCSCQPASSPGYNTQNRTAILNAPNYSQLTGNQAQNQTSPNNTLTPSDPVDSKLQQIALLLPLSGPLQNQAKAIQNGFFAAYYATKQSGFNPSIRVYNTQGQDILAVYQQAQTDGANFIVGPLLKSDIQTLLAKKAITLPTLALNTTDDTSATPLLYQFGLSPTDEAQEVAARIWQKNRRRVIVIAPSGEWSQNIVNTFQQSWQELGGSVADVVLYNQRDQISEQIRHALNIDGTESRYKELHATLHHKIRFLPYRRQDFDAIFFVASNDFARQIVPILKFYFAGNVPTYTLSSVFPGANAASRDPDLNDVIFDDMPWVLNQAALAPIVKNLYAQAQSTWPGSFNQYKRLIALGVDSYLVIPRLDKLSASPQLGFSGATGVLYVLPNQHIYRQLSFAQFKDGRPVLLN